MAAERLDVARIFHDALNCAVALSAWAHRDCRETGWRHAKEGCRLAGELVRHADRLQAPDVDAFLAACPLQDVELPAMRIYAESWHHLVVQIARSIADETADALDVEHELALWIPFVISVNPARYWPAIAVAMNRLASISPAERRIKAGMRREWLEMEQRAAKRPCRGHRKKLPIERPLTKRQIEVVQVVGECKGNIAEAAKVLGRHHSTIQETFEAATEKLGRSVIKPKTTRLNQDRRGQSDVADGDDLRR